MSDTFFGSQQVVGPPDLRLPDGLREPLREHLEGLRARYAARSWARRVGFGEKPAVVVVDLALFWTRPDSQMGSDLDGVVESTRTLLDAARAADVPVFFTTLDFEPGAAADSVHGKVALQIPDGEDVFQIDPRLGRRPTEPIIRKRSASGFKNTTLDDTLKSLGVDTVIVTGVSTSHCVAATCRDATTDYRVIVPREAVGDRCEIMHLVYLVDIDIDVGDVMPSTDVIAWLGQIGASE